MNWYESEPVVEAARGVPAPALRQFIAWYSGYRYVGVPAGRHRGLPLLRVMRDEGRVSPEVGRAWGRLVACRGRVSVGELAREAGWSTRLDWADSGA